MHGKSFRIVGLILAIMLVALVVVPASASPVLQSGGNGVAGVNSWQTLQPGTTQEWILTYTGDNENANIELGMNPGSSVGFNVFTDQQWKNVDLSEPVGQGTIRKTTDTSIDEKVVANNGDLFWSTSSSGGSQVYHIQVYPRTQQPAQYWINAFGPGVGTLTAYNSNATNTNLQGQLVQTGAAGQANGTTTAPTIQNTSGTNTQNLGAPRTLPVTGGMDLVWLLGAALMLIAAGLLTHRRQPIN
jgi:hypothetical protein